MGATDAVIGYERVSTARGRAGSASRRSGRRIDGFAAQRNATLIARFTEVPAGDCGELNARGMLTRLGGSWHVSTVTNLLDQLENARCASPR